MSKLLMIVLASLAIVAQAVVDEKLSQVLNDFSREDNRFISSLISEFKDQLGHNGVQLKPGYTKLMDQLSNGHYNEIAEAIYITLVVEEFNDVLERMEPKMNEETKKEEGSMEACKEGVEIAFSKCRNYVNAVEPVIDDSMIHPKRAFVVLDVCKSLLANKEDEIAKALYEYKLDDDSN